MKTIWIIFLTIGLMVTGERELGLGIVSVDIYKTKEIKVYKSKGDKVPEKVIRLINKDSEIFIEEKGYEKWLKPESLSLDYSIFIFRYMSIQDNWIEIIVNDETMNKRWIQKSQTINAKPWDKFLIENTTAVDPRTPVEIKVEPNASSKTIRKSTSQDCFDAIEIKGDWMKIKTNEDLECSEHPEPIKAGWIRWRQNNQLMVHYYLAC